MEQATRKRSKAWKVWNVISWILILLFLFTVLIELIFKFTGRDVYLFGTRFDVVLTDSMSVKNKKYEKCLRISKMGDPVFLSDLLNYKVRQLDLEYIHRLADLHFVREGKNLIICGASGTGKTWMGQAIATKACEEGIRTRWVTYPKLCRELLRLKEEDSPVLLQFRPALYR